MRLPPRQRDVAAASPRPLLRHAAAASPRPLQRHAAAASPRPLQRHVVAASPRPLRRDVAAVEDTFDTKIYKQSKISGIFEYTGFYVLRDYSNWGWTDSVHLFVDYVRYHYLNMSSKFSP